MRVVILAYAAVTYLAFLAVFAYFVAFFGNFAVPRSIDVGPPRPAWQAAAIAAGWLLAFGVQHSVMARAGFKRAWTRLVPPAAERTTYVLVSTILVAGLMWSWSPIEARVWDVTSSLGRAFFVALSMAGWGLVVAGTFFIDHFEFFGLRQAYDHLRGRSSPAADLRTPWIYRFIRHPIYLGFIIAFWSTPTMTVGHLLLALGLTAYILVGVIFEERDLIARFGDGYRRYRRDVGMLLPRLRARASRPTSKP